MARTIRYQGAIIRDHHMLLIMHTEHASGRGYWVIPGGGIEPGESEEACVAREMLEETCLQVQVERLLLDEPSAPGASFQRRKTFLCRIVGGEAAPGYEPESEAAQKYAITEIGWFDLRSPHGWDELLVRDPITFPMLQQVRAAHERIIQAVHNNARWCDTIGRLHGRPGEFRGALWLNRHALPRFYPNAVTLSGAQGASAQRSAIQELIAADTPGAWGVKDSFCTLDLAADGFRLLFEAAWLWRAATLPRPDSAIAGVEWSVIHEADSLAEWEAAWSGAPDYDASSSPPRIFLPALLADESLAVIAARQRGRIVAGAIANLTDAVVGISNVFTPAHDDQRFWAGCIAGALDAFGDRPLVGYERGPALATALALGFEELGPLRVWLRQTA